jgi:holliday junction DNA helicase RuvB
VSEDGEYRREGGYSKMFDSLKQIGKPKICELFENIEGYEDLKEDIIVPAIEAERSVSILLSGPPATAKTMFLEEIREAFPDVTTYVSGSTLSRKGLVKLLYELKKKIKFLLIDEVDKLNITDQKALYDIIENGRVTYHTGELNLDFKLENLKIIATSNSVQKLTPPLQSRFNILYLPEYSYDEFERIAIRLLVRKYKILTEVATETARVVWNQFDSHDVRLVRHIGVLIAKRDRPEDIERKVLTLRRFKKFDNNEWDR